MATKTEIIIGAIIVWAALRPPMMITTEAMMMQPRIMLSISIRCSIMVFLTAKLINYRILEYKLNVEGAGKTKPC
jgi:hypothetical protein